MKNVKNIAIGSTLKITGLTETGLGTRRRRLDLLRNSRQRHDTTSRVSGRKVAFLRSSGLDFKDTASYGTVGV